jgi:RHS repeat-associated protein
MDYLYNGKELEEEDDWNWYAYGARYYDPAIGRFSGVDPIAERFPFVTVFNYAENEPISYIDLHGLQQYKPNNTHSDVIKNAPHNFVEGMKVLGSHVKDVFSIEPIKFDPIIESVPVTNEDYWDPLDPIKGTGIEIYYDGITPSSGVLDTPTAEGGADALLTSDDIYITNYAGLLGGAASKNGVNNFIYHSAAKTVEITDDADESLSSDAVQQDIKWVKKTVHKSWTQTVTKYKQDEKKTGESNSKQ